MFERTHRVRDGEYDLYDEQDTRHRERPALEGLVDRRLTRLVADLRKDLADRAGNDAIVPIA